MRQHKHATIGNHDDSFITFRGCRVKGFVRGNRGIRYLIFDCGWALAVSYNGAFWAESPDEVKRIVEELKDAVKVAV